MNDDTGEACPPAVLFLSCLLLTEITAFLRETFQVKCFEILLMCCAVGIQKYSITICVASELTLRREFDVVRSIKLSNVGLDSATALATSNESQLL